VSGDSRDMLYCWYSCWGVRRNLWSDRLRVRWSCFDFKQANGYDASLIRSNRLWGPISLRCLFFGVINVIPNLRRVLSFLCEPHCNFDLQNKPVCGLSRRNVSSQFPAMYEHNGSLPCSQQLASGTYPELVNPFRITHDRRNTVPGSYSVPTLICSHILSNIFNMTPMLLQFNLQFNKWNVTSQI
jgi:hypothetical protein